MYFVLLIDQYYPRGGIKDSTLNTSSMESALKENDKNRIEYAEDGLKSGYILDGSTGLEIESWQGSYEVVTHD